MYTHTVVVWRPSVHLSSLIKKDGKNSAVPLLYETKVVTESEHIFLHCSM